MKKTIDFFLASSIVDVQMDRIAIGDFINQLNSMYNRNDIFINLYKCESDTMSHTISVHGSQFDLDTLIKQSDLCFVLFWHKVGDVTVHELNIAYESFKKYNKPKIVVYFKTVGEPHEVTDDIKNIMNIIDNEMHHYHREYDHIDSLKLGIITQLQINGFINNNLIVDGTDILDGNLTIANTNAIPLFLNNSEYNEIVDKMKTCTEECERLKNIYLNSDCNAKCFRDYQKAQKELNRVKEDYDELTKNILAISNKVNALTLDPTNLTTKFRTAIMAFDKGDYDAVLNVLSLDDLNNTIDNLDNLEAHLIEEREKIIKQYDLRIQAQKAKNDWLGVDFDYKAACKFAIEHNLSKWIIVDYIFYLYDEKHYDEAIELALKFLLECKHDEHFGIVNFIIGKINLEKDKINEAKKYLEIALKFYVDNNKFNNEFADACSLYGFLLYKMNEYKKSEEAYYKAIDIYSKNENNENKIANNCIYLGDLFYMINHHEDAEKLYREAYTIFQKLANIYPNTYNDSYVLSATKLIHLSNSFVSHRITDKLFIEAQLLNNQLSLKHLYAEKIKEMLNVLNESINDDVCNKKIDDMIKRICLIKQNQSNESTDLFYYDKIINTNKIEALAKNNVELCEKQVLLNPDKYESVLANAYNYYGFSCLNNRNYLLSEKAFNNSIKLFEKLSKFNPNIYEIKLAMVYSNLGFLYNYMENDSLCIEYYNKALSIYYDYNHETAIYNSSIARTINYLGIHYEHMHDFKMAFDHYFKAFEMYFDLYLDNPNAYLDRVLNVFANMIYIIDNKHYNDIVDDILD